MSSSDFAAADAALAVFAENNVDTVEESIRVTVYGQELSLSLLLVRVAQITGGQPDHFPLVSYCRKKTSSRRSSRVLRGPARSYGMRRST
jgi:hypothetical protein